MMAKNIFLLADDDSDDKELFSEALRSIDINIVCHITSDGSEALEKLSNLAEKPHLIFLDINMPVMNGWQCIKALKQDEKYVNIPVIIISTSSHQREMDLAQDFGALCYVTKPNDFNELRQVLQIFLAGLGAGLPELQRRLQASGSPFIYTFKANDVK